MIHNDFDLLKIKTGDHLGSSEYRVIKQGRTTLIFTLPYGLTEYKKTQKRVNSHLASYHHVQYINDGLYQYAYILLLCLYF